MVSAHPGKGVVLMPLIGCDARQLWMVDDSWQANQGFALVNKATGRALSHDGTRWQVSLIDYDPKEENEKIMWTLGPDAGEGYFALRATGSNRQLYLDISEEKVDEGAQILAYDWKGGLHQMWSLEPIGLLFTIRSKLSLEHALTADPTNKNCSDILMKPLNESDPFQLWTIETHFDQSITIHNVGCKLAIRGPTAPGQQCRLGELSQASIYNMWLLGKDEGECYFPVRPVHDLSLCLDAMEGKVKEECGIILYGLKKNNWSCSSDNQMWGFFPKGVTRPIKPT